MSAEQGAARKPIQTVLSLLPSLPFTACTQIMLRGVLIKSIATPFSTEGLTDHKEKRIVRAIVLRAERDYSDLLAAAEHAAHHRKEGTESWQYLLDQILQDARARAEGLPPREAIVWTTNIRTRLSSGRANVFSSASSPLSRLHHVLVVLQLIRKEYLMRVSREQTAAEKSAVVLNVLVSLTHSMPFYLCVAKDAMTPGKIPVLSCDSSHQDFGPRSERTYPLFVLHDPETCSANMWSLYRGLQQCRNPVAPEDQHLPAESASEIRKNFERLVKDATHSGELKTWQSFLQEMEMIVRNNPHWDRVGLEPNTAMEWICAVWIRLQQAHHLHQVNAVVVLQYVWEDYQRGFVNSLDGPEVTPAQRAELLYDALEETCVSGSSLFPTFPGSALTPSNTDGSALPGGPPSDRALGQRGPGEQLHVCGSRRKRHCS